jgi:hypothetical protein
LRSTSDVGLGALHQGVGLVGAGGFADHLEVGLGRQQAAVAGAHHGVVVDQYDADHPLLLVML